MTPAASCHFIPMWTGQHWACHHPTPRRCVQKRGPPGPELGAATTTHCAMPLLSSEPPGHQSASCLRQNSSSVALRPRHYVRRVAGRIFSDAFQSSCNVVMLYCSRCLQVSHQSITAALLKQPMVSAWGWCCLHMGMGGQGDPCHLHRVQSAHVAGGVTACVGITVGLGASLCGCPCMCTSLGRGYDTGCGCTCHRVTMSVAQGATPCH